MNLFSDSINVSMNFFFFLWSWRRCADEGQDITRMEALVMHGRSVRLEHSFAGEAVDILANLKAVGFNSSTAESIIDVSGEGIKSSVTALLGQHQPSAQQCCVVACMMHLVLFLPAMSLSHSANTEPATVNYSSRFIGQSIQLRY